MRRPRRVRRERRCEPWIRAGTPAVLRPARLPHHRNSHPVLRVTFSQLVSGDWSGDLKLWRTAAPEDAVPAKGKGDGKKARKTVPTQVCTVGTAGDPVSFSFFLAR